VGIFQCERRRWECGKLGTTLLQFCGGMLIVKKVMFDYAPNGSVVSPTSIAEVTNPAPSNRSKRFELPLHLPRRQAGVN
jgi:hypothetical protein